MKLSIVTPLMNESENIEKLYRELKASIKELECEHEIVFIDDGSRDESWMLIEKLYVHDDCVKGIRFSRNYGHQIALFAGLQVAEGDAVISMDADLQHPADVIPALVKKWQEGYKIVNTKRIDGHEVSFLKKLTSRLFYKVFSFLSGVPVDGGMADFRLLDQQVVQELRYFREQKLFLRGLVQIIGFSQTVIPYQCQSRFKGQSKYSLKKMIKFAWIGISSFSMVPLRMAVFIGAATSFFAFLAIVYAIWVRLFTDLAVAGWASAVSIMAFLFGIMFILMGVIGEYLGRILIEVRDRPRFIVEETVGFSDTHRQAAKKLSLRGSPL